MKWSKEVQENLDFLAKHNIPINRRKGGGNVVTTDYWNEVYYIGLQSFKFRKAHTKNWVQKDKVLYTVDDVIEDDNFKGKVSDLVKDPKFVAYLEDSPYLIASDCLPEDEFKVFKFVMPFGKWQGNPLQFIYRIEPQYLDWMVENLPEDNEVREKIMDFLSLYNPL